MGDPVLRGPTIKVALMLAFGLTVGLWLFAGYQFTRRMAAVEREATAITARYTNAQQLLSTVRVRILVGSVYVRDALLDPNPGAVADYRARLIESYDSVDAALGQYVPVVESPEERERVTRLRREIGDFRNTMLGVLDDANSRQPNLARQLLQQRIVPKRELVIRVSEDVQALNRGSFVQQQASIADVYRVTQRQVWNQLGLALVASLGIALVASLYSARLETQLRLGRARDLENAREMQQLSAQLMTAQEEERRAIARELHDEVGQVLAAIKVELAVAQASGETAGIPRRTFDNVKAIVDGALQRVRDLSHLLHPAMLDDLGLATAVDWHLRGFSKRHDVAVDFRHEGMDERLDPATETTAFRIVQEALTNVVKHARARSVQVRLERDGAVIRLTVTDDGQGFAEESDRASGRRGLGLRGIRERVSELSGTLEIESGPGCGTRIVVELPAGGRELRGGMRPVAARDADAVPISVPGQVVDG
jgi:signal transduction histidine kinase